MTTRYNQVNELEYKNDGNNDKFTQFHANILEKQ